MSAALFGQVDTPARRFEWEPGGRRTVIADAQRSAFSSISGQLWWSAVSEHIVHFFRDVHGIRPITKQALAKRTNALATAVADS